ncbi:hypothetical protein SMACR_05612 [Sordaria macrospora]|uniref:WGS project CABT00000000 data, contig 2.30 n=2 Tax=Sordaria macrospora TaxID=5147 RepID=F7W563_SORMK|nr:uncharacterized protein SMAC_05612 [Sordaria macrospora k-hell]KAA8630549.1 hypothetical protein SMACR_05612 [Sordaria macrospora]WPJ62516.1 hypothetical protein SMAC4_05612 [Sordaria macrospora]CCC12651.1 unnamed protein product [Sordaria macrospora k-hell]
MSQSQSLPPPDHDPDLDIDPNASPFEQAHTKVLKILDSTPYLTAEERVLYILDLVRYASWQANGLSLVLKDVVSNVTSSHVQVAIESLGNAEAWKAEREEWLGFAKMSLGVEVLERVVSADEVVEMPTAPQPVLRSIEEPNEYLFVKLPTEDLILRKGGEGEAGGSSSGADVDMEGDGNGDGGGAGALEEATMEEEEDAIEFEDDEEDKKEDEKKEEIETVAWKYIVRGLQLVLSEMNDMNKVPENDYSLIRSSLEVVQSRLGKMMDVYAPLLARIKNTLPDAKGLEQKLDAMEEGRASNEEDASGSFRQFRMEYKSLLANLVTLVKVFVAHGIPCPCLSAEDKLIFMDMIVSEMERMVLKQEGDLSQEVLSKFKPVKEELALLDRMYAANLAARTMQGP